MKTPVLRAIGTDVELFAVNAAGEHIALCGKIGGTKEAPMQIANASKGFCFQEDNVALEFNIPPASLSSDWINYIKYISGITNQTLKKMGLTVSRKSSVRFSKAELTHPNAFIFGCEPDYNAWTMEENPSPKCEDETLRTAGGHVHVSTNANMIEAVKHMDLHLGVPSILLDSSPEAGDRRRLYGKAGAMRPKPYGFEYRVLSNFWVFEPALASWVYKNTRQAILESNTKISKALGNKIQTCINTGDKKLAEKIIETCGIHMG